MSELELSEQKSDAAPAPAYNEDDANMYSMRSLPGDSSDSDSDSDSEDAVIKPAAGAANASMNSFAAVSAVEGSFQLDWRNIKVRVRSSHLILWCCCRLVSSVCRRVTLLKAMVMLRISRKWRLISVSA